MPIKIQLRRGTASQWAAANPVLAEGELVAELDTGKFKIGNGTALYSALSYPTTTASDITLALGFTPIGRTSLSVGTNAAPSGSGNLAYNSTSGVFTFTPPVSYSLPIATVGTASTGTLGGVKVDGLTVFVDTNGVISSASLYSLPTASTSILGGVKIDGTTITINGSGVINANYTPFNGGSISSALTLTDTTQSTSTSTGALIVQGGAGIAKNVNIGGTVSHAGLSMSSGTNIDQVTAITKSLTLIQDWIDTGIDADTSGLVQGTYAIQLYANDTGAGGTNLNEYYSGLLSWFVGSTNDSSVLPTDEIQLHRAGQGVQGGLFLRTFRTLSSQSGHIKLQIYSNTTTSSNSNYVFKFRRLI